MKKHNTKKNGAGDAFVSYGLLLFLWLYPFFLPNSSALSISLETMA